MGKEGQFKIQVIINNLMSLAIAFWLMAVLASPLKSEKLNLILLPFPQEVELSQGFFDLNANRVSLHLIVDDTSGLSLPIKQLQRALKLEVYSKAADRSIQIGRPQSNQAFEKLCRVYHMIPTDKIGDQGYVLLISKERILLTAQTNQGLFYGVQTLIQLVERNSRTGKIPCLRIEDWPHFQYRGLQDDISRGPVPTLQFLRSQIRRCAEMKLNMISYYIENVVATKKHGDFAPAGGAISIEQWQELSQYAEKYFVQLVGNFQSFGHFEKIAAYPQYAKLAEANRLLSPAFPESYQLLQAVYEEMAPVFSSPFFNVNCDETFDLGRGASQVMVDSLGFATVYADHLLRLSTMLKKLGKRPMMWADVALKHPEILSKLPPETILIAWEYSAQDSFDFLIEPLKRAGFEVMVAPGVLNSRRVMPDYKMTRRNIKGLIESAAAKEVLGVLTTVWDDGGSALFSRDWYGVGLAAEKCWNPQPDIELRFDDRFDRIFYGDNNNKISTVIHLLSELTDLAPTQEMNESVLWETIIPDVGERISLSLADWDRIKAICDSAEQVLKEALPDKNDSELAIWQFTIEQYQSQFWLRKGILEAASHYRNACLRQNEAPPQVRDQLLAALQTVSELEMPLVQLAHHYTQLWLRENLIYWLDKNLEKYQAQVDKIRDLKTRLLSAWKDFEQGHSLPPPTEVRLEVHELTGQYFQSWLLVGPFPLTTTERDKADFLKNIGGESKAHGQVAGEFKGLDNKNYRWKKYSSPKFSEIDLAAVFNSHLNVIAYAYATIESQTTQMVEASCGSNDGIKIICNGELIFQRRAKRNLIIDEDKIRLPLKKGQNHLLLKIDQADDGWGFSFRLPQKTIRNHDFKYKIIE